MRTRAQSHQTSHVRRFPGCRSGHRDTSYRTGKPRQKSAVARARQPFLPISHIMSTKRSIVHCTPTGFNSTTLSCLEIPGGFRKKPGDQRSLAGFSLELAVSVGPHQYRLLEALQRGPPAAFIYRARPRNAIIARSTSTTCSAVSRPTRAWTFDLLTVVSLSIITSLS